MKKILAAIFIAFGLFEIVQAVDMDVWKASNSITADSLKNICSGNAYLLNGSTVIYGNHGVLHGVCVNTGINGGNIILYDSSITASGIIATVSTSTGMPCSFYDVSTSSGLTYTKNGTADTTILYQCF